MLTVAKLAFATLIIVIAVGCGDQENNQVPAQQPTRAGRRPPGSSRDLPRPRCAAGSRPGRGKRSGTRTAAHPASRQPPAASLLSWSSPSTTRRWEPTGARNTWLVNWCWKKGVCALKSLPTMKSILFVPTCLSGPTRSPTKKERKPSVSRTFLSTPPPKSETTSASAEPKSHTSRSKTRTS